MCVHAQTWPHIHPKGIFFRYLFFQFFFFSLGFSLRCRQSSHSRGFLTFLLAGRHASLHFLPNKNVCVCECLRDIHHTQREKNSFFLLLYIYLPAFPVGFIIQLPFPSWKASALCRPRERQVFDDRIQLDVLLQFSHWMWLGKFGSKAAEFNVFCIVSGPFNRWRKKI